VGVWILTVMIAVTASAAPTVHKVTDVALSAPREGAARIVIKTTGRVTYGARIADGGKRILLDVHGTVVAGAPAAIVEGNRVVAGVMTQSFRESNTTRVLLQLAKSAEYSVSVEDDHVVVDLEEAEKTAPMSRRARVERAPSSAAAINEAASVRDVRYGRLGNRERIVIDLPGAIDVLGQ